MKNNYLSSIVSLNDQFKRSVNISSDAGSIANLNGFICPATSEHALVTMINQITVTGESSFTWTGPYGSGKSSLALLLKGLTSIDKEIRNYASSKISINNRDKIANFFCKNGWKELSIVGSKNSPEEVLKKELDLPTSSTVEDIINSCIDLSNQTDTGLIIYIDEMGKLLENQSSQNHDIYFFQLLAESVSRSNGRIIFIGILHQSFSEYARNLTKLTRDEWAKIQGRFLDIPLNIANEEQIELIGQAIISEFKPKSVTAKATEVSNVIATNRRTDSSLLAEKLSNTWPLHPATSILITELSKKRFGQNQRSIFSFLMSAEPAGFRGFLQNSEIKNNSLFTPALLWDYLKTNLESSIVFSSDTKVWATAADVIAKCEASEDKINHASLLKAIATISIFKGRSGLEATEALLQSIFDFDVSKILQDLKNWSFILFKKHTNGYALFEGSDFDIDHALSNAYQKVSQTELLNIDSFAGIKPIVAKRHYHRTGALRWLKLTFQPVHKDTEKMIFNTVPSVSEVGKVICLLPSNADDLEAANTLLTKLRNKRKNCVVLGIATNYKEIFLLAQELKALEWIDENEPLLSGDSIARREIESRISILSKSLENKLYHSIENTNWLFNDKIQFYRYAQFSEIASIISDDIFSNTPQIPNEMLNRDKPSGNANGALRALLKAMVSNTHSKDLGISGYPPERGLYESILKSTDLHNGDGNFDFRIPLNLHYKELYKLWIKTDSFLNSENNIVSINDIYSKVWLLPPFGIKKGLFQPLLLSYILSKKDQIAIYLDGAYYTEINDYFIDYFFGTPKSVAIKLVARTKDNDKLLLTLIDALNLYPEYELNFNTLSALDIGKSIVKIIKSQNKWVHRTKTLSKAATQLREVVNNANDPNKLVFEDIPLILSSNPNTSFHALIDEVVKAYPLLIEQIGKHILDELQINLANPESIEKLRLRAKRIQGKTGDFRVDALTSRLSMFDGNVESIAGIASLAANKPIHDWIDQDIQRALKEISALTHQFNKAELLVKVKGVPVEREAYTIFLKSANATQIVECEIELLSQEKEKIDLLSEQLLSSLGIELSDNRLKKATVSAMMRTLISKE